MRTRSPYPTRRSFLHSTLLAAPLGHSVAAWAQSGPATHVYKTVNGLDILADVHRKPGEASDRVTGIGGSPGVVEGVARVVLREDQFDEVRAGDILVCHMTNPAWVVLFTKIAGLVTNAGGLTAHPAVLSREFGIPAVVGTQDGTQRINTGDRLRVDGGKGVVEIVEAAAQPKNDLFTA